ncbi:MAG TPA: galactose-1-phosphate uridylyltransferase [Vicinamibacterales bacterium]|nr:galactose-1-phosphate uridylyltransferase [Vicinamibacterales bacterium]
MPELRRDPVTGRWVIISTDRQKRPNDFRIEHVSTIGREQCPFCPGREAMTPPEVLSYRQNGGAPNTPGWDVRVVPNKFPALQVEGTLDRQGDGMFDRMNGIGAHEVIIETPDHDRPIAAMSEPEIERVLWAYRERILDLKRDIRLKHILVFKNHGGAAGATLDHPHSQLIALPVVPEYVREELDGARAHFERTERCVFCDIVVQELRDGRRVVQENADIVAIAPYAPRFAFETWLVPKAHGARFEQTPRHVSESLARLLKAVVQRLDRALESPPWNLVLHTAPASEEAESYHWHVEIMPRLTRVAGFEWGTGFYINPTAPEEAAKVLRSVRL